MTVLKRGRLTITFNGNRMDHCRVYFGTLFFHPKDVLFENCLVSLRFDVLVMTGEVRYQGFVFRTKTERISIERPDFYKIPP